MRTEAPLPAGTAQELRERVKQLLADICADGGEERFISDGYEAHDAIVEGVVAIVAALPSAPVTIAEIDELKEYCLSSALAADSEFCVGEAEGRVATEQYESATRLFERIKQALLHVQAIASQTDDARSATLRALRDRLAAWRRDGSAEPMQPIDLIIEAVRDVLSAIVDAGAPPSPRPRYLVYDFDKHQTSPRFTDTLLDDMGSDDSFDVVVDLWTGRRKAFNEWAAVHGWPADHGGDPKR